LALRRDSGYRGGGRAGTSGTAMGRVGQRAEVTMKRAFPRLAAALTVLCGAAFAPCFAHADGKVSVYLSRMEPNDVDARRFSRTSWGIGIDAVLPWYAAANLVALTSGLEITNMLSHSTKVYDPILRETLKQRTNQSYGRFFVGGRAGPHGAGFVRPHIGANVAVVWYGISTDIDIPDPSDPNKTITKNLESNSKAAFGYDVNAGMDLNVANSFPVEIGVRYLKSYNVPQPLGQGAVSVSPAYLQTYVSIGVGFDFMRRSSEKPDRPEVGN
jgi:opacity protein-like surface antigen